MLTTKAGHGLNTRWLVALAAALLFVAAIAKLGSRDGTSSRGSLLATVPLTDYCRWSPYQLPEKEQRLAIDLARLQVPSMVSSRPHCFPLAGASAASNAGVWAWLCPAALIFLSLRAMVSSQWAPPRELQVNGAPV